MPKKSKTTKKPRASKTKKPMEFADGKVQTKEDKIEELRRLEKAIGITRSNPFRTEDEEEFNRKIAEMNLTDMQALAVRAGVFPSGTRPILRNKLRKAFHAARIGTIASESRPVIDRNSEEYKRITGG